MSRKKEVFSDSKFYLLGLIVFLLFFSQLSVYGYSESASENKYGKIVFQDKTDLSDSKDSITISKGFIGIDTKSAPWLDSPAYITFYGVENGPVLRNNEICDDCEFISYSRGKLTVFVRHFSNYSVSSPYMLAIRDSKENGSALINASVTFYANYTNNSVGINSATCRIRFPGEGWSYMSPSNPHNYSKNFSTAGLKRWNVSCNRTGYPTLNSTDTVMIYSSNLSVSAKGPRAVNSTVNFYANFTDSNLDHISGASCNLTFNGTWIRMFEVSGKYYTHIGRFDSTGYKTFTIKCARSGYSSMNKKGWKKEEILDIMGEGNAKDKKALNESVRNENVRNENADESSGKDDPELSAYISDCLNKKFPENMIRDACIKRGWDKKLVDDVINGARNYNRDEKPVKSPKKSGKKIGKSNRKN